MMITFETIMQLPNPLAIINVLWRGTFGSSLSFLHVISLSLSYFASCSTVHCALESESESIQLNCLNVGTFLDEKEILVYMLS